MKIVVERLKPRDTRIWPVEEFADKYGLELYIAERKTGPLSGSSTYVAYLRPTDTARIRTDVIGTGSTPYSAACDYIKCIQGCVLVVNDGDTSTRQQIHVPSLVLPDDFEQAIASHTPA